MVGAQSNTILLVDDDAQLRELFRVLLESLGYTVIAEAANGREAVARYRELKPDAVVMDIYMPVLDGLNALKQIMKFDPEARVIMLTTEASQEMYEECLLVGAKRYIPKDTPMDRIRERILESIHLPMLGG